MFETAQTPTRPLRAVLGVLGTGKTILSGDLTIYDLQEMIGAIDLKAIVWHPRS